MDKLTGKSSGKLSSKLSSHEASQWLSTLSYDEIVAFLEQKHPEVVVIDTARYKMQKEVGTVLRGKNGKTLTPGRISQMVSNEEFVTVEFPRLGLKLIDIESHLENFPELKELKSHLTTNKVIFNGTIGHQLGFFGKLIEEAKGQYEKDQLLVQEVTERNELVQAQNDKLYAENEELRRKVAELEVQLEDATTANTELTEKVQEQADMISELTEEKTQLSEEVTLKTKELELEKGLNATLKEQVERQEEEAQKMQETLTVAVQVKNDFEQKYQASEAVKNELKDDLHALRTKYEVLEVQSEGFEKETKKLTKELSSTKATLKKVRQKWEDSINDSERFERMEGVLKELLNKRVNEKDKVTAQQISTQEISDKPI